MKTSLTTALSVALTCMAISAGAQTTDENSSYTGVVTGTNVNVRSAPGTTAYPCTRLSRPEKVKVVGSMSGWLKIEAPDDVFCVISKKYVKPDSSGDIGTVTDDNIWVRAGGPMAEWSKLTKYWVRQGRLSTGAKVKIIGQGDDFYKIAPPKGAYYWISADYVKPVTRERTPDTTTGETRESPDTGGETPTTRPAVKETRPKPKDTRDLERERFKAAEELLQQELQKPKDQRDLEMLLSKYKNLDISQDSYLQTWVDARIEYLQTAIEQNKDLEQIDNLVESAAERQRRYQSRREELREKRWLQTATKPAPGQSAKGVLSRSAMFPGGATGPRRYMLQDPATGSINAYAQSTDDVVDLSDHVGQYVSVTGKGKFDEGLGTFVIDVRHIEVLETDVELPAPPRPRIAPPEPPAPPTEPEPMERARPTEEETAAPKEEAEPEAEKPAPKPETKPEAEPPASRPVDVKPEPEEKPEPVVKPETKIEPETESVEPEIEPEAAEPKVEPEEPKAEPEEPKAEPEEPETEPEEPKIKIEPIEPEPRPDMGGESDEPPAEREKPATETEEDKPLPPTGLPLITPETRPDSPVDTDEYK